MKILAYDPYVSPARAGQLGAQLVALDELLAQSDFITIHLPKTPETLGLIGEEALPKVKPTVRIINAARGGIVDEDALARRHRRGPGRRRRHRRLRHRADAPSRRSSSSKPSSSPRTWAPRPTRPRRRPASPSPSPCAWPSPASSSPTPSTSPAASSPRRSARASRWSRSSAASSPRWPAASRPSSTSRCAARSPRTTSACWKLAALKGLFTDVVEDASPTSTRRCSPSSAAASCAS